MKFATAARLVLLMVTASAAPMVQCASAAADASYPTKPIRLIVPFSPGGTNDILGRMIATHLTEVLGKTMIVDNRAGAEGIIGTELAAKAAPDGYTLIVLSAAYVMNPAVRKLPYDPLKALDFIAKLGSSATVLCSRSRRANRARSRWGPRADSSTSPPRCFAACRARISTSCCTRAPFRPWWT
jgi:tripartite-type tricarboxylate transporter receptor subunit TctC